MVDYSKYSTDDLLDVQKNIDPESQNYPAFLKELDLRQQEIAQFSAKNEAKEYDLDKLKVTTVGYFQIGAAIVLSLLIIYSGIFGQGVTVLTVSIAIPLIVLNAIAGITAIKLLTKWYWLSILNQILQVVSLNLGSFYINYAGLGYINIVLSWGQEFSLGFDAQFSPGFNFYKFTETLPLQTFGIDIMAIIFILAFIRLKDVEARA
ncbi:MULTISPECIES: hypothetical protein [unclassified Alteromonas]|uniref:hypothetical protein n=1 Tax=unclassified Alteromonas TaxID=2614992 RepID=UPI00050975AB|nr:MULTISPECIES: hypothetical protein [unclassified Alteromonas]